MHASAPTGSRAAALAVVLLTVGLAACGSDPGSASPPKSAAKLKSESSRIVGGGTAAFKRQLAVLKGTPVVVNQWASWCGPCKYEFPFFARLAFKHAGRVAFLGVDAQDNRGDAAAFLRERPIPYPSFFDPAAAIARTFKGGLAWPTTAFYDAAGKLVSTHAGGYASEAKLAEDVRTHAVRGVS